jgi:formylglycine-generating enzyme required for sulfatase activity/tRNA A-37 threonylcarbamoyl transferase component Bud32
MSIEQLGKYKIETFLGKGAFAEVYKALDESLKRIVALKMLKPALLADEDAFGRFLNEARVLADLVHPHIAWVWDMGEADGRVFIAMRYVEGQSLDKVIAESGPLPWGQVLKITEQVAGALDFAHKKELVHRDVKPQNIMISKTDGAVLTDFGLVKALHSSGISSGTSMIGTPAYMAPEIWDGKEASPASDQYALACVLVEMLTGKALFAGTTAEIMKKHLLEPPTLPEKWTEGVPDGLNEVLIKALARKPQDRYPNLKRFFAALEGMGVANKPLLGDKQSEIPEQNKAKSMIHNTKKSAKSTRKNIPFWLWIVTVIGGILLIVIAIFLYKFIMTLNSTWTRPADGMTMVYIQAGKFLMGSDSRNPDEKPEHTVTLDDYWIDQNEVTNKMYEKCVTAKFCQPPDDNSSFTHTTYYGNPKYANYPVIFVSWNDASNYCAWVGVRLPSEAEWEKAARGSKGQLYPWGNSNPDKSRANYGFILGDTSEVGSFPNGISPYGVKDMAGNVGEWVNDWYSDTYYSQSPPLNPSGPDIETFRVIRGGSWYENETSLLSTTRFYRNPSDSNIISGFRCASPPKE